MDEFKQGAKLPAEAGGLAAAPTDVNASTLRRPGDPEFSRQPKTFPRDEKSADLIRSGSNDSPWEQPEQKLQKSQRAIPPPDSAEGSPGGSFRGGGGRHRGFSPQRLKSSAGEDS